MITSIKFRALMMVLGALGVFILTEPVFAASSTSLYGEWPAVNVDNNNLNVAPDTRINAGNVANLVNIDPSNALGMLEIDPTRTGREGVDSTPVVADGIVYVAKGGGTVAAFYANGPNAGHPVLGWVRQQLTDENGIPDAFDSSPVVTKKAVFIAGRRMHKLDRLTGVELAAHLYNDDLNITSHSGPAEIVASQLMVAGKLVLYGTGFNIEASGGFDALALYPYAHGEIIAFNQSDLSIAWHLDLPSLDANGNPLPAGQSYGAGMGSFGGFGVDESRHLVFVGTSNQYSDASQPCFQTNTCVASPLSNALLAIDYTTGKIVWSYQYAPNDLWGSAGLDTGQDGKRDLDVHAHPQIFSINLIPGADWSKIDLVGARGKDGTYRIFTRDQIPGHVQPIAQVKFDPPQTSDGGIGLDPAIKNGILYIASSALVEDPSYDDAFVQAIPGYTAGRHTSLDILYTTYPAAAGGQIASYKFASTTVRAIDLRKLIYFGLGQLVVGNKLPVCAIDLSNFNPNVDVMGNPVCQNTLPEQAILWTTLIRPIVVLASSGLTYDNGVLIIQDTLGKINFIDAQSGALLPTTLVPQPVSSMPPDIAFLFNLFGFHGNLLLGGVSAVDGYLYAPVGIAIGHQGSVSPNPLFATGGLVIYKLP